MWPFGKRRRGRHELGAAVRSLPSLPVPAPPPMHVVPPVAPVPVQAGHRVELGFRDGSVQELVPGSAQAVALEQIASALARRD